MGIDVKDFIRAKVYETYIPRRFILEDNNTVFIPSSYIEEVLIKEPLFLLYVPPSYIDDLYTHLKLEGFEEAIPAIHKGERYGIRKPLDYPWELHMRLYKNGFIEAEVEVQREYLEHLGERRLFVVFEAFEYYRDYFKSLHIFYKPANKWVINILDHFKVRLNPPQSLTPWKPVVATVVGVASIGILLYALSRLSKGEGNDRS